MSHWRDNGSTPTREGSMAMFPDAGDCPVLRSHSALAPLRSTSMTVGNADVHLWLVALDVEQVRVRHLATMLEPDEQEHAGRFHFQRDRNRYTVARGMLREVLSLYTHVAPRHLRFRVSPRGKPALASGDTPSIRFNVSHSQGIALLAVAHNHEIGVDIERRQSDLPTDQMSSECFGDEEMRFLNGVPAHGARRTFFQLWTRKEAYLKATGKGIATDLKKIDVASDWGNVVDTQAPAGDSGNRHRWSGCDLILNGCIGALVIESTDVEARGRRDHRSVVDRRRECAQS